jgi:hypothetical protein
MTDDTTRLLEILGEIKSTLERIENAILNGPHITIGPTPVYPPAPTLPQPYFGDPVTPGWPATPTITCSTQSTQK